MSADVEPLSVQGLKAPEPRPHGAVGALQWIAVADLRVDRSYQRDIRSNGRRKIAEIAAEFDWSCFSPVICAPAEGGGYAIIDGQHRSTAAMLIGIEKVPALIVIADRARQAKSFASINGTVTRMNSYSVYRAARAAGDETVLAIDALCASCGVRVLTGPRERSWLNLGETLAVRTMRDMYDRHGPAIATFPFENLTAPSAGMTFIEPTLEAFKERMLALRAEGLSFPDTVLATIDAKRAEQ